MKHLQVRLLFILMVLGSIVTIGNLTSCAHKSGHRNKNGTLLPQGNSSHAKTSDRRIKGSTRVKMIKENGVYYVPITVNGLNLRFVFDTGASSVLISSAEAAVMYRQGLITQDDILGQTQMKDASGNISTGTIVNLKTVVIGGITLQNVEASVVDNMQAPLLFGQSALSKFGKVSIDYDKGFIEFN